MERIQVGLGDRAYEIVIGPGARALAADLTGRRNFLVTDSRVAELWGSWAAKEIPQAGSFVFPAGERHKTPETVVSICRRAAELRFDRKARFVALGGGVVGDLAGFAAATWLRGVAVLQVPTSLLAFVDSSIGGKTGIDLPFGKNLAGAFHQPVAVVADPTVLQTLPELEFRQGMAEVVKYGCIMDKAFFEALEKAGALPYEDAFLEDVIARCAACKIDVVNRDEREGGLRMLLNFGHTLGHAAEKVLGYGFVPHGVAVGVGMVAAARLSEQISHAPAGTAARIETLLQTLHLPTRMAEIGDGLFTADNLFEAMLSDKKKLGSKLHFVLLRDIGEAFIAPLDPALVRERLPEII